MNIVSCANEGHAKQHGQQHAPTVATALGTSRARLAHQVGQRGHCTLPPDLGRMAVIRQRSEGLLHFTQTYRQLSQLKVAPFQTVPVWALFEHVLTLLEPTLAQRGIEPDVVLADPDLGILADPTLIEQVLINLLTNALEALHTQPAPRLRLAGYVQEPHRVVLEVADNGAGIPAGLLEEIFVPFFTTKPTGSGIGLSLSRQIMQLHRGSMQAQSTEGTGSQFYLFFPTA